MPRTGDTKTLVPKHYRVTTSEVLRNVTRLRSSNSGHRRDITADLALTAGCTGVLSFASNDENRAATVQLIVGDDYAAGFRDGFNCSAASRTSNRRYVEGLEDGGEVGRMLRHGPASGAHA